MSEIKGRDSTFTGGVVHQGKHEITYFDEDACQRPEIITEEKEEDEEDGRLSLFL